MPRPIYPTLNQNPNLAATRALTVGVEWNNKGQECIRLGDYEGAVACHRQALQLKLEGLGKEHTSTAISLNALAEALMKVNNLDEAETVSKMAVDIASRCNPATDQAYYRETLALVYEMKGDLELARETRKLGRPDKLYCTYANVGASRVTRRVARSAVCRQCTAVRCFQWSELRACSRCKVKCT